MKNVRSLKLTLIALMVFFAPATFAQGNNAKHIPAVVAASFIKKYPGAMLKGWKAADGRYTAKAIIGNNKCFATFGQDGNWIKTATKSSVRELPAAVRSAFKKTRYITWNVYYVKNVKRPTGQFYQVLVDNTNHKIDALHQHVATKDFLLEFKANGELTRQNDITGNPVP